MFQTLARLAVSAIVGATLAVSAPVQAQAPVPVAQVMPEAQVPADALSSLSRLDIHAKGMVPVYVETFDIDDPDNGLAEGQFAVESGTQAGTFYLFTWVAEWDA